MLLTRARSFRFRSAVVATIVLVLSSLVPVLSTDEASSLVAANRGPDDSGDAAFFGSTGGMPLNRPIVGMAATPDGRGYWLVASDGGIFNYGDAAFFGSTGGMPLNRPIVGMAATPDGRGYWLVASDGGIFNYGDAAFFGSTGGMPLNRPIVGMAATPDGRGYWLVASDGGIFNYGDAAFFGSTGGMPLNRPIVGMAATPDGRGYWLVASDGGIFNYGDAAFFGSTGGMPLNRPIVGMAATPDGRGYWLVASDGGIFNYGDAAFFGSTGGMPLNRPIVGMAATPDGRGYWLVASDGGIFNYGGISTEGSTATLPTTTTTTTTTTLSPPAGYTSKQLIFDDQFSGTSLDTTKWNTFMGSQGIVWNDDGNLPPPYSGPNVPTNLTEQAMFGPSQVAVNNGLTLTAQPNTNGYAGTYPWISGVVTTEGKFSLPTGGWYVQVEAKMPDESQGMWPAIWFLPGVPGTAFNEFDGYEGGSPLGDPNQVVSSIYFADQGFVHDRWITGADVTAGYHTYGYQFIPGQAITLFFDGKEVWHLRASTAVTITAEPYEIILQLEVAGPNALGWHTLTNANTPTSSMEIAQVQAYSIP